MISVCIATYNGEKYLAEQLQSILSQLSENDEIVISDDNSQDRTIEIAESFADPRIFIIKNSVNKGVVRNFERALEAAKGDYIFLSDQDDVWLEGKVALSMQKLHELEQGNKELPVLVFSDMTVTDENLKTVTPSQFSHTKNDTATSPTPRVLSVANRLPGNTLAFNRKAKEASLPIEDFAVMHDWWISCSVVAAGGAVAAIEKPLVLYRQHSSNVLGAFAVVERGRNFIQRVRFNRKIYRMSRHFFRINPLQYLINKIRLHV